MSVAECDWAFYECLEEEDYENAASYYETLKLHYKRRGKRIKELLKINGG